MSVYLFQNGSIYFERNGKLERIKEEAFLFSDNAKDSSVQVMVAETIFKRVDILLSQMKRRDEIFNAQFSDEFAVQDEKLKNGVFQLMAASAARLRAIARVFPIKTIKSCVPYALAVRALLLSRGIINEDRFVFYIDDLGDKTLLTVFRSDEVVETRALLKIDPAQILEEVFRSEKKLFDKSVSDTGTCVIASNAPGVIEALRAIDDKTHEGVLIDGNCPVFDAFKSARFLVHFMLPEDIFAVRKEKEQRQKITAFFIAFMFIFIGLGVRAVAVSKAQGHERALQALKAQHVISLRKLNIMSALTYQDRLRHRGKDNLVRLFHAFLWNLPAEGKVESFLWERGKDERAGFSAVVSSRNAGDLSFGMKGLFASRRVVPVFERGRPALRVSIESSGQDMKGEDMP
ncbi:MAG: hypothetical protein HQL16_04835 [Candidatus Omnitrophica bacterium]|nr:hypothetical protein [Candidatus Omnitrophota bacterium]